MRSPTIESRPTPCARNTAAQASARASQLGEGDAPATRHDREVVRCLPHAFLEQCVDRDVLRILGGSRVPLVDQPAPLSVVDDRRGTERAGRIARHGGEESLQLRSQARGIVRGEEAGVDPEFRFGAVFSDVERELRAAVEI